MTGTSGEGPAAPPLQVLVVEDAASMRALIASALEAAGATIQEAADAAEARRYLGRHRPDVVVLDLELPDASGLDLLRELLVPAHIPAVILSGHKHESDRVTGLELGAADYVVKPFFPRELAVRVRRAARRNNGRPPVRLSVGDLVIDSTRREVLLRGRVVDLTAREFDLLARLATPPGQAYTREQLLRDVWQSSPEWQSPKTVTEHVRRLRQKIEDDPRRPRRLVTIAGRRYRLEA